MIITVRELIPDPAPLLTQVPTNASTVVSVPNSTLTAGTYATVVTQVTAAGETVQSAEVTGLVVGANQGIQSVTVPIPGATGMRIYFTPAGGAAGSESSWVFGNLGTLILSTPGTPGVPPVRSTAYVPDQDGQTFA